MSEREVPESIKALIGRDIVLRAILQEWQSGVIETWETCLIEMLVAAIKNRDAIFEDYMRLLEAKP